jgi:mannose-6-phosphate isomerase-like protein (cupin superfamily)
MALEHDERPWGNYAVLDEGVDYKVKRITVHAGKRLNYQGRARREEH